MAGVFCLVVPPGRPDGAAVARRLSDAMRLFPWQRVRLAEVERGRVWLGAMANASDAAALDVVWDAEGPLAVAVEGWILRARADCGATAAIASGRHAAAAVAAYRRLGAGFAAALEGQFNVILHDAAARRVLIGNSRHAHSPLYLHESEAGFGAATNLGPLGACGLFPPAIAPDAAATLLAYGQLFADRSLLAGVRVMDAGTVLEVPVDAARAAATRYWHLGCIAPEPDAAPAARHVGELADALKAAGRLATSRPGRYVAGLSGGLDSRLNLAAVLPHAPELKAWTFGVPGASDLEVATAICRALGIGHLIYPIDPAATPANAADFVATVDGCVTAAFAYQLDRARDLSGQADIVLNGFAGEVIVRGVMLDLKERDWLAWGRGRLGLGPRAPHPRFESNRDPADACRFLARKYGRARGLDGLTVSPVPSFAELAGPGLERLRSLVPHALLAEAWIMENRGRRWTMMGIASDRHFYADGSVFYDYDFHDRCFATPARHRRGGRLYLPLLQALDPRLAAIPSGNTGLPLTAGRVRTAVARAAARTGRRGRAAAVSTGALPSVWTRGALREACEALVTDPRTQGRPWWRGDVLARRWRSHLAGELDASGEIGLVAAIELFARRWVDPVPR